ncbi:hypothetical protein WOLCODRAFT_97443 [Wolfiporia cocos MD-104 SS10]|uniref:SLC41A/MgtE integral membrane domain-containing protein n=1 Tax=Wolfiporia cocos (strain MD-104) TaxID=742152 RepID=A0A2H3JFN1_WOLCO|nr:hypothetical protein WOLCODRAFT_97443 [Wolfiporia cocos MD-104 SS10]
MNIAHEEPLLPASPSSSETIELAELEDIVVTPAAEDTHHRHAFRQESLLPERDDSDDEDDEGNRALLGSHAGEPVHHPARRISAWVQIKSIVIETFPTLLVTTVGLLFTGELLNVVSHWQAMTRVDELIMIIPVILNLKGNLEMNLSARLGTAANVGELDKPDTRRQIILGNLTLLQVQAAVVSFVAACVSFGLGRVLPPSPAGEAAAAVASNVTSSVVERTLRIEPYSLYVKVHNHSTLKSRPSLPSGGKKISGPADRFIMVASAAMCSTSIASLVLGSFMCMLIVLCRRFGLDPDNIAPPVAACLGDLVTLGILGFVSVIHVRMIDTPIPLILVILLSVAAIAWAVIARRNRYVRDLLTQGWWPLFAAMIISSGTGIVLDTFVSRYRGYALISIVITGLPGGVGAIFVSRLSTALHAATMTLLPSSSDHKPHPTPRLVMLTLLAVSFPIQIIFLCIVYAFGWLHLPIVFVVFEVLFFCIAVSISLGLGRIATNLLWKFKFDPDMYALPLHSSIMDLVGQLLLVACYEVAFLLGAKVRSKMGG